MYYVYIDGELAFDHLSDDSVVSSASVSQKANAAAYLDMSLAPSARPVEGQAVEVWWDGEALFHGRITDATQGVDGTWDVSCVSDEDRLNGVLVPPHSSDGSVGERCPATVSGYVQWLAETFNRRCVGGWRVDVGANEGDLLTQGGSLSVSDSSWPTVAAALEDRVLSLGGWLDWEPREGGGTLSVYADVREASGQVVDMGENVADVKVTRTTDGQRTALVAHSGDLTLDGLSDDELELVSNAGMMVENGAVYDPEAVALYGYSESREELQAPTRPDLVRAAIARLRTLRAPRVTVEARAVDTSVYREGASHLRPGQAVRARALPLGLDEYLAVQSVDLDLMDPGQTLYTLGVAYDTLTGQQSARLRELNLGIDHSLDLASGAAGAAQSAHDAALSAQGAADAAQSAADAALDAAQSARDDADAASGQAQSAMAQASEAARAAQEAAGRADEALEQAQQTATDAAAGVAEAKDAAQAAKDAADEAKATADGYQQQITEVTTKVGGIETDVSELSAEVSGAVEDAEVALSAATKAQQDLAGFKTTVEQTYQPKGDYATSADLQGYATKSEVEQTAGELSASVAAVTETAEGALSQATQAKQTADSVKTSLETNYVSKTDASQTYASKAELSATSSSLSASIEEVATTADAAQEKALEVEATADGLSTTISQVSTVANQAKSAADTASTAAGKAQSTADSAVRQVTSLSATVDGIETSVAAAQETADSAVEAASAAQQSVDGFKTTVSQTYATKTSVSAVEDKADAAQSAANSAASAASAAQSTANTAKSNAATAQSTANTAKANAATAQTTANTAKTNAAAAQDAADAAQADLDEYKGTVSATYATKSSVEQTADSITQEVAATYQPKGDYATNAGVAATYATKTALAQTEDSITAEVAKTYQTKDGMSSYATKSYVDQQDNSIKSTVSSVKTTADSALTKATTVEQTAEGLEVTLTETTSTANSALSKANSAASAASTAQSTANTAKSTADSASKAASTASTNASTALSTANTAKSTADSAKTTADTANSNASTAKTNAQTALNTANTANSNATTAKTNAQTALDRATYQYGTCATAAATASKAVSLSGFKLFTGATVQVKFTYANTAASPTLNVNSTGAKAIRAYGAALTASSAYNWVAGAVVTFVYDGTYWNVADGAALSKANSAQTKANSAASAASTAQSTANTANSTANAAKTAAATAQTAATNAAKTATNYLGFSSGGLVVGDQTAGELGKNVLIDADSVDVRDGTTVLASFGADLIELGRNSARSSVEMCGGEVRLSYSSGSGLLLNTGLYAQGAVSAAQLSSAGVLNATGPLYLGDGQRAAIRGVYAGTVVVTLSGGHATLLTKSQFTSIVGREPRATDVVLAANGDRAAYIGEPLGCAYNASTGTWYVGVPNSASGPYRANYLIIATA